MDGIDTAAMRAAYAKCNEFGWPADIRALCDEIDALRAERERYVAESEEIVAYANALRARLAEVEERYAVMDDQSVATIESLLSRLARLEHIADDEVFVRHNIRATLACGCFACRVRETARGEGDR